MDGITLTITLQSNGQLQVNGPLHDRMVCYGMLELARDTIRDMHAKAAEATAPGIIPVHAPLNGKRPTF